MKYISIITIITALFGTQINAQETSTELAEIEITTKGPQGDLAGSYIDAGDETPVVLIIPGSGPTDRNGNNPQGVTANSYALLAQDLRGKGISTVRIDKRGMFGSASAVPNGNDVTIAAYGDDVFAWADSIRDKTGQQCIWLAGHSEGGLVALSAAQNGDDSAHKGKICGVISIAAAGRSLDKILRSQLEANPANTPVMNDAFSVIDKLKSGETADVARIHPALQQLFAPEVQPYLIDLFSYDPAQLAATIAVPLIIIQGDNDIQVSRKDAELLAGDMHELVVIEDMNHVLKTVGKKRSENIASYSDPSLPISPQLVDAISNFIKAENQAPK